MTEAAHIFISYAREDGLDFAERLENELRARGKPTWRDKRNLDPNQDFTAELEKAIEQASHVVVCVTPDTKRDNSFVRREIGYALALGKRIIPLIMGEVVPPIHIINLTRIDFLRQAWSYALNELLKRLDQASALYEEPTPPEDPFRDYLNQFYQEIVNYLDTTVFSLIALHAQAAPGQVQPLEVRRSLPIGFSGLSVKSARLSEEEKPVPFNTFSQAFQYYSGRVLLLGEPGTGKTTTLMAFARDAIARRLADPFQPLPLLAPVSTWDAEKTLAQWLMEQSEGIDLQALTRLIAEGKTLLLLDALDELGSEHEDPHTRQKYDPRSKFMQILPSNNHVLVSCRVKDYAEIGEKIALKGAVTLQPLDDEQMAEYLRDYPILWKAVQNDSGLRDMARTPLLLSLFTYAYHDEGEKAQELQSLKDSPGDLKDRIFRTYVERRYRHEKAKANANLGYTIDEIYRYLGNLALVALRDARKEDLNVIQQARFLEIFNKDASDFIELTQRLHLLIASGEKGYRFIHLLIRDHFTYAFCIAELNNLTSERRSDSVRVLGTIGDKRIINQLMTILQNDGDQLVRAYSARALGKIGDPKAFDALVTALRSDPVPLVRAYAGRALGRIGDERGAEAVIEHLRVDKDMLRMGIAVTLGRQDSQTAELLVEAVEKRPELTEAIAMSILGIQTRDFSIESLVNALKDENEQIRMWVVLAFGEMDLTSANDRIISLLLESLRDTSPQVRMLVASALGRMRESRTTQALISALNDPDMRVKLSIISSLGLIADSQSVQPLLQSLNASDEKVSNTTVEALTRIGTPDALSAVEKWRREQGNR